MLLSCGMAGMIAVPPIATGAPMHKLEPQELRCLQALAAGSKEGDRYCSMPVLVQLLAKGLIAGTPHLQLPLEWAHVTYTLTATGKAALQTDNN